MIAEVIVDVASSEVDRIFDYRCDETVTVGCRVSAPFGPRTLSGFVMRLKEQTDFDEKKLKTVVKLPDELPALGKECLFLADKIAKRYRTPKALALRLFLPSEMRTGKIRERYKDYAVLDVPISEMDLSKNAKKALEMAEFLQQNGKTDCAELRKISASAFATLQKKGYLKIVKEQVQREPYSAVASTKNEHVLTDDQARAVRAVQTDERTVQLLHGVTGSGKTEVYLTLIATALEQGKSSIFLVPEISLTPQMLAQLRARFGKSVAILHSGLSAGERFDEWWRLRTGEAKIAVGARSAVFAPLENLGVIVMDEEHDGSYCSDQSPRYSTLEIALLRAKYNGCKLVLGSATPSVETYQKAKQGEYGCISLKKRINQKPLPEITVTDMRREVRRGNHSPFSSVLKEQLDECLQNGNQAILFLNRRGFAPSVVCRECGHVVKCLSCDVSLTYHHAEKCLKCHFCGAKYQKLSACPECGSQNLSYAGTGTQRIEDELKKLYPSARVLRMDNDTTSGKEGHYKILKAFAEKQADVLVGTQMIAKGHDFPSVTLVGILDADMSLHFPDFRSNERTFQLITQVAGRSGRAEEKGKVVLQTFDPENEVLRFACAYDYEGFYQNEISLRQATAFPPYSKIVRVLVTGNDDKSALEGLREVYEGLEKLYLENMDKFLFFNKMHAPIKRIKDKFRYQVLMRLCDVSVLPCIYDVCVNARSVVGVSVVVEENPSNLS